jgi:hypothetical protein
MGERPVGVPLAVGFFKSLKDRPVDVLAVVGSVQIVVDALKGRPARSERSRRDAPGDRNGMQAGPSYCPRGGKSELFTLRAMARLHLR